jgi:hypothetical protein
MAFRKISYLIRVCDGCGLAWSFFHPACADGIPPHFAGRAAAMEQLSRCYGWQVRTRRFGPRLMACRACAAAGLSPAGASRGWLLAVTGWVRRLVPFGPVRRPLPPSPGPGHPESLTAELPAEDEEWLAAIEDENFREL